MISGRDEIDLLFEKRFAGRDFVGFGIAVFRRAAFHHIGNVNVLPPQSHPFGNNVRQELSSPADKRLALKIFVTPRPLTDNISLAWGLPTPKTILVLPAQTLQRRTIPDSIAQLLEVSRPEAPPCFGQEFSRATDKNVAAICLFSDARLGFGTFRVWSKMRIPARWRLLR